MKLFIPFVLLIFIEIFLGSAYSSEVPTSKQPTIVNTQEPPTPWERFKKNLFSPVTTPAANIFWPGMALTAILAKVEDNYSDHVQTEMMEDNPLKNTTIIGNVWGSMVPNVVYYLGMKTRYWIGEDYKQQVRANHMAEATLYTVGVVSVLKITVREPRPNHVDNYSFPSGHSAMSFVFATIVTQEHGWGWGIPAYMMATFVSATRLNDNWHYTHDVIAGATLGIAYGYGIYYNRKHVFKEDDYIIVAPIVCHNTLGIGISKSF